ncbi:hypothetical protein PAHAL_2G104000 [Panicum hallii]|uniref:Uncharacterized protein n=1 Tax=Panicum hallii TaxID=206008 RepID=A0A2T8KNK1_9POAL|nr:hypothetical protein PAHAL_2G104000 [Panicum hallii]
MPGEGNVTHTNISRGDEAHGQRGQRGTAPINKRFAAISKLLHLPGPVPVVYISRRSATIQGEIDRHGFVATAAAAIEDPGRPRRSPASSAATSRRRSPQPPDLLHQQRRRMQGAATSGSDLIWKWYVSPEARRDGEVGHVSCRVHA